MDTPTNDPGAVDPVPEAEPVGAASSTSGVGATPGRGRFEDANSRYNSATSSIERSAAVTSAQGYLTPLEQFGKQTVAYVGAALVFVGLWLPVKTYTVSVAGFSASDSWNMWSLNSLWAIVFLLAVAATAFVAWQRDYRLLWATAGVIAVAELANLIFTFSAPSVASAHPSWGWILLIPGVILIAAAAALRPNPGEQTGDAIGYVQNLINSNRTS